MVALTLREQKASETIGQRKKLYPTPVPDWGRFQGKAGTWAIKVKMAQGEVLDQRDLSV